jgi:SAM-dependent methyltransferase
MALFDTLRMYLYALRNNEEQAAARNILRFPPKYIDSVGRLLFDNLQRGGVATFVVPGRVGWDPQAEYFRAVRDASKRGLPIKRLFLLPHRHYMREKLLHQHWKLDCDSGIQVDFAIIGDYLREALPGVLVPRTLDFGIWDDELTCYIYTEEFAQPDEWIVSNRAEDVESAKANWHAINRLPKLTITPADTLDEFALEEPLIQTAPLANLLSTYLCKGDHIHTESCHWYHQVWQYLRIMDLVSTPTWHSRFYLAELPNRTENSSKILISGTADYSILAYVIRSFHDLPKPSITVLDMCETPLHLCRWYGSQHGIQVNPLHRSIFDLDTYNTFDLITTDAFLTRFPIDDRLRVLRKWFAALVKGGKVVTTVRVERTNVKQEAVPSTQKQVQDFVRRATQLAQLWHEFVQIDANALANYARVYAQNMVSFSALSPEQIRANFLEVGFEVIKFDIVEVKGEMKPTTYVEIVARK